MGCGGSKEEGETGGGAGSPGKKQGQGKVASEQEKDAAAAAIQGFAQDFMSSKEDKKKKEQDAAAGEIQTQAAKFLVDMRAKEEAARAAEKPKLTLPAPPLAVAATNALDAVVQLSHRLFGGAEPTAADATKKEEPAKPAEPEEAAKPVAASPAMVIKDLDGTERVSTLTAIAQEASFDAPAAAAPAVAAMATAAAPAAAAPAAASTKASAAAAPAAAAPAVAAATT